MVNKGPGYVSIITFDAYRSDGTLINSVLGSPGETEDFLHWQKAIKVTVVDNSVVDDGGGEDDEENGSKYEDYDLDGDGVVGTGDLLAFLGGFGGIGEGLPGDVDGDESVTIADMLLLLGNYGAASDDYEGGVTPLNLCSYPELQDAEGMITYNSVISYWSTHQDTFFDLFDPALEVAGADTNDINVFITASIPDGTAINCNIG